MKAVLILLLLALLLTPPVFALVWRDIYGHWPTWTEAREAIGEAWRDTKEDLARW
jgi:hypothetical protein